MEQNILGDSWFIMRNFVNIEDNPYSKTVISIYVYFNFFTRATISSYSKQPESQHCRESVAVTIFL